MISENLTSFNNKPVKDFQVATGIENPESTAYRLRVDYDGFSEGQNIPQILRDFCQHTNAAKVTELIIGAFDFDGGGTEDIVSTLVEVANKLPQLKALFIGDITYEENEISWIHQSDVSPVLKAYPALEYLGIRGGNDLTFGKFFQHQNLRQLIVQSGGLPPNVIEEISAAILPSLEHLELWLGSESYGFSSSSDDFSLILKGANFPKLKYLGLRDSEIADELAKALPHATIVGQLDVLDLSMGTLGDDGALAILNTPSIRTLKKLDLHHHYISPDLRAKLNQLGIMVNLDDPQEGDEDERYISVAE